MPVFPGAQLSGGLGAGRLMKLPCTIEHVTQAGAPDEYGTPAEVTTSTDTVCWLSQASRTEADGEVVQQDSWSLYLPAGTVVDGGDRVTVGSDVFEVDGPPWSAVNPRTLVESHIEATVKRAQ